jgi:hypothetical protein
MIAKGPAGPALAASIPCCGTFRVEGAALRPGWLVSFGDAGAKLRESREIIL